LEGDGGKEVMSDGAFLAEGPFLVPCCGELGLNELFNVGGGVRSVIKGRFVASFASSSASSLPLCPWWLGIQKKVT
jgi:hypothetical protein